MKHLVVQLVLLLIVVGCGQPVIYTINNKEKVIEKNAPPQPAFFVDKFTYKRPGGRANVLWVVDNTWDMEELLEKSVGDVRRFRQGYERASRGLVDRSGKLKFINVRAQVILTPSHQSPANFVSSELSVDRQFDELFAVPATRFDPHGILISNRDSKKGELRDSGMADPFESTTKGFAHPAFKDRGDAAKYVVFVNGSSANNWQRKPIAEYVKDLTGGKPLSTVDTFHLVPGVAKACRWAVRPNGFLEESNKIGWNVAATEGELCGAPETWADAIVNWVAEGQSGLRLSFIPLVPEQIVVATNHRTLSFGTDFTYDSRRNQILLKPGISPAIVEGEPMEVRYFQKAVDPVGGK